MKLSSTQIYIQKTAHLSIFKWQIVWRQKVLENVRRQLRVGKTVINKQTNSTYNRSVITKILLKLYFSPNIVSRTFRQVILAIFTAVFGLLSRPCGLTQASLS